MNLPPEDERLARNCRFNLARTVHALNPGNTAGDQTGGSLIFQDHRVYVPGDDLRRIDWRAFGRTDTLMLKTYQEEVAPFLEVLVDASASMAVSPAKAEAARRWTWFFVTVGLGAGYTVEVHRIGLDTAPLRPEHLEHVPWRFDTDPHPSATLQRGWKGRHRALRVLISDFLFDAGEMDRLLARVAREAMTLHAVQLLAAEELDPPWRGAFRLEDDDGRGHLELVVGEREAAAYRERLHAHQAALRAGCRRRGGACATLNADGPTRDAVMKALVPAGILEFA